MTQLKELLLSRQTAEELYGEQREKPFFSQLLEFMCRFVSFRPTKLPSSSSSIFLGGAFSLIISATQNQVCLSFTVHTQREISSAPADPSLGRYASARPQHWQNNGEGRGHFEQGKCMQVGLETSETLVEDVGVKPEQTIRL